jgi:hypothetical protein
LADKCGEGIIRAGKRGLRGEKARGEALETRFQAFVIFPRSPFVVADKVFETKPLRAIEALEGFK